MFRSRKTPTPEQIAAQVAEEREKHRDEASELWARLDANAKRLDVAFERMKDRVPTSKEPKR